MSDYAPKALSGSLFSLYVSPPLHIASLPDWGWVDHVLFEAANSYEGSWLSEASFEWQFLIDGADRTRVLVFIPDPVAAKSFADQFGLELS